MWERNLCVREVFVAISDVKRVGVLGGDMNFGVATKLTEYLRIPFERLRTSELTLFRE
jgi:hypothetical protein